MGSLIDGDDEEDWDFAIGKSVEVGRGKGRSRSRSVKSVTRKTPAAKSSGPASDLADSSVANKRGRRQSLLPEEVPILEDLTRDSSPAGEESIEEVHPHYSMPLTPVEQNTIGSHSEHSTIRSTSTGFGEDVTVAQFDPEGTPEAEGWSSPRVVSAVPSRLRDRMSSSLGSPLVHQVVEDATHSSPSANEIGSRDDQSHYEEENYDNEAEDDLGDLQEFDTILESEGFSMISVDSVPSLREHFSSPSVQSKPVESVSLSEDREADHRSDDRSSLSAMSSIEETSSSKRRSFDNIRTTQRSLIEVSASNRSARAQPTTTTSARDQDYEAGASELSLEGSSVAESAQLAPLVDAATTSNSDSEHPTTPWLPTPEETPSPDNDSAGSSAQETSQEKAASVTNREIAHHESTADSSINMPQMRSSPPSFAAPRYTYTAHLRQRKSLGLTETPSIVFSSPSLPPPKQRPPPRDQLPSTTESNGAPKPHLSSSVIAGRALQDIVVPNSSSTHSSFLRSPFKSPNARRHPLSPTEEPTKETTIPPSKLDSSVPGLGPISWRNLSRSRTLSGAADERKPGFMKNIPLIVDDPFLAEASEQLRSPSPEEKDDYSLGLPTPGQARNPQIVNLVAQDTNAVRYSDEMSWQADYPAMRTPPRDDNEASESNKATVGSSRASDQMESQKQKQREAWPEDKTETTQHLGLDLTQVYVVPSDLPTINSTPSITQAQPAPKAAPVAEDVFNDDEDIWLAEARSNSSPSIGKHVDIAPKQAALERPRRSKLPSPWRQNSRRLVYSDELAAPDSPLPNKNENSTAAPPVETRSAALPATAPFAPKATLLPKDNTKANSVLAKPTQSQLAPKAVLLPRSTPKASDLPSGAPQLGALRRSIELPKPQLKPFMAAAERPQAPPVTQDYDATELSTWDIPQKQNFKPRITPRQSNILGISALLASSPEKKPEPFFVSSPGAEDETVASPTQKLLAAETYNDTTEVADYTQESSQFTSDEDRTREEEYTQDLPTSERDHTRSPSAVSDLSVLSRTSSLDESSRLSTTPARQNPYHRPNPTSPLKSCLRLPTATSPTKAVVFSATTAASPSVVNPRFMEDSEWAKTHWLSLRAIYWDYKKNPTPAAEIPQSVRESEYAGKTVWGKEADGSDSMVMEVWMVDVVHMFLDEAEEKGMLWDEAFVCKRLFGLIGIEGKREAEKRVKEEEKRKAEEMEAEKKKGILGLGMGWL